MCYLWVDGEWVFTGDACLFECWCVVFSFLLVYDGAVMLVAHGVFRFACLMAVVYILVRYRCVNAKIGSWWKAILESLHNPLIWCLMGDKVVLYMVVLVLYFIVWCIRCRKWKNFW